MKMRAHFAGDVVVADQHDTTDDNNHNEQKEPLDARIDDFKRDSKNMEAVSEFIDDLLKKAEVEAVKQQQQKNGKSSQQGKEKSRQSFTIPDFKNGKVVNRARGFVVRIFDAICNCANNAAAAPAQRFKLRGKRNSGQTTTNGNATESDKPDANNGNGSNETEIKEKSSNKKQAHDKKKDGNDSGETANKN